MSDLSGLHIVVTGGGGALGRAVVEVLVDEGATCHAPRHDDVDLTDEAAVTAYYQHLPRCGRRSRSRAGTRVAPSPSPAWRTFDARWR